MKSAFKRVLWSGTFCIFLAHFHPAQAAAAKDPFEEYVRSTDARTPADELTGFHLPPGFEVQLFAAEPEIGKPLQARALPFGT